MSLVQTFLSVRDLGRLHEIAGVLIRYGFGDLVRRLGMAGALEQAGRVLRWRGAGEIAELPPPVRLRRVLEELGPTFVKFGQMLSTRVDLLEPEWTDELGKLLDGAPPVPFEQIRGQLTGDLGAPVEEVFAHFDPEPIASASVAQVYRARLRDGTGVVVKVQRPGIRPVIEADLRWMGRLAEIAEESADFKTFAPRELARQLSRSLLKELDFTNECRNAERIAAAFEGYRDGADPAASGPLIVIPRVFWEWASERVCVQEFIDGIPGRDLEAVDRAGLDRRLLARRGARAMLKMILEDGVYHADPHPGNLFYLPGNRIALIDFGLMGRLTEARRDQLVSLLLGLVQDEPRQVMEILLDWTGDEKVDEAGLQVEIQHFVDQYNGVPLQRLDLGAMLADLAGILRAHRIAVPVDLALLIKAFVALEGTGRELDPGFDMAGEAEPVLRRALLRRMAPGAVLRRGLETASGTLALLGELPGDLSRLLRAVRKGRFEVRVDVPHVKRLGHQVDRAANRVAIGNVTAALVIGSAIVMTVPGGPKLFGLPAFGLIGFTVSGAFGLVLLVSIWKTRKDE
jgi:ubiquinone biosynthesis protein